jgi:predicted ATPase
MARSRLGAIGTTGLTPLVGREQEIGLLRERWTQVKDGFGQVVLLSGEAGIGKSRLVQVLTEHIAAEPQAWLTPCQCSPYHQNTALYPMIELLERVVLRFDREEAPKQKLSKLAGFLVQYGLPLEESVPLFASLLSLPLGTDYAPLSVSPEQQKQKTLHALLTILLRITAQQPCIFTRDDVVSLLEVAWEPRVSRASDVRGRLSLGPLRPERSSGRHVHSFERPNRCPEPCSP